MRERLSSPDTAPIELSSQEVLDRWVAREGSRYVSLLVERGFLLPEETVDAEKVRKATKEWRLTYVEDLKFEQRTWKRERVEDPKEILSWRLGGWKGWLPYRPAGQSFTTFGDVITAFDASASEIPDHHRLLIPEIARSITDTLQTKDLFVFRCGANVAALDGTHTLVGLAYAMRHEFPVLAGITMYVSEFGLEERSVFEAFCESRPVKYGGFLGNFMRG